MNESEVSAIKWQQHELLLLDQRLLPEKECYLRYRSATEVANAIRTMVVRGAPAIGIAAAYGVVLAALEIDGQAVDGKSRLMDDAFTALAASRPTAVNLFWALERMRSLLDSLEVVDASILLKEARHIHEQDIAANLSMGEAGVALLKDQEAGSVLTHCNAGSLATGGYGTALGVIRSAHRQGLIDCVYAGETRPWLQGSRLTAWELSRENIPVVLIADGAAAHVLKTKAIKWVIVGADRIAANGDVVNKIGTYSLAVQARYHGVKMMVVAPMSTVDFNLQSGAEIIIEERSSDELTVMAGQTLAPDVVDAFNPVFDVTPADLIDAIVTEKGVVLSPDAEKMKELTEL